MSDIIDQFGLLDPDRKQRQVDAAFASNLRDQWSILDPVLFERRFNALEPETLDQFSLLDIAREVRQINASANKGYVASAVHVDHNTWALLASLIAADSPLLTFSVWANMAVDPATAVAAHFFYVDSNNAGNNFQVLTSGLGGSPGTLSNYWATTTTSDYADMNSTVGALSYPTGWLHFFGNVDTNHDGAAKINHLWINGMNVDGTVFSTGPAATMNFNGVDFAFPSNLANAGDNNILVGDFADLMFYPGQLITDISIFRNPVTGKPNDPSTFPQGAVMLSGDASRFLDNSLGTEGPLVLQAGSLTNATTHP